MARTVASVLALGLVALSGARLSGDTIMRSALHDYRVVTVVDALVQPAIRSALPVPLRRLRIAGCTSASTTVTTR